MLNNLDGLEAAAGTGKFADVVVIKTCESMRRRVYGELQSLKELKDMAWKNEIIKAGFLGPVYAQTGKPINAQVLTPHEVNTGNRMISTLCWLVLIQHSSRCIL